MSQWQPIETAPKDGTEIILIKFRSNGEHEQPDYGCWGWYCDEDPMLGGSVNMLGWLSDFGDIEDPTHWMYPPPAPGATA